jgi:hypothetical protein
LVALVAITQAPWLVLAAAGFTMLIFSLLEFLVQPRLYNQRQQSALWVVLLMIVLGRAFGLTGVLAAPPLAAALQILFANLLAPAPAVEPQPVGGTYEELAARFAALRADLESGQAAPESQVQSLADRLQGLLDQAGEVLKTPAQSARRHRL